MAPNDTLARLDGPYEAWVFGDEGQSYAAPHGKLAGASFVSALAELPVAHQLFKEARPLAIPEMGVAHRPTIWRNAAASEVTDGTAFLPIIFEPVARIERSLALPDLRMLMLAVANHPSPPLVEVAPRPHHGFRLNTPLPPETFDRSFAEAETRPEPKLQPNARLKKELPRDGAEGAPLVIMAVIDDGLAYAHPALRDTRNDPRMEFCWLQSAESASREEDRTVLFGREHTRETLADLLKHHGDDEDAFYREAGSIRHNGMAQPVIGLSAHGAHVLSLAAGSWGEEATPAELDRIRLLGVELPSPVVMDTVGFGKDAYILSAFHYIFDRADKVATAYDVKALPLVINFSFGFTGGPHDGNDRLADAISALIKERSKLAPTELVMPAGNQFLSSLHARIPARAQKETGDRFIVPWRIQPNDQTANYLEIWYPPEVEGSPSAMPEPPRISGPGNLRWCSEMVEAMATQAPPQTLWPLTVDGRTYGQVSIDKFREARWRVTVILAPTETTGTTPSGAPAGLWRIDIDATPARTLGKIISCRIQHDRNLAHPLHHGRQSYFDHPEDPVFADDDSWKQDDSGAKFTHRFGSLNGLATRDEVIVVAGVVAHSARGPDLPAPYSAAGEPDSPSSKQVTCAAISDHSPVLPGVRAAGTRSGSVSRLSGTSAAAPQVARARALCLLRGSRNNTLKSGDTPPQQGITAKLDLKPRPAQSGQLRQSGNDPLLARIGAGVLDAGAPG
ncbi:MULTISPECIES: hypothetical protein [unclassified Bosea (in: a-proteobacteria)]|uniref:hypothetical protein n=1 Tax=unclassified Bosea (in: a-proteobacteria) TaxID=2653178 RepID=UPI000F7532EB|nr:MULTISPECIES: hypothetical protein [unclassified Bosea (in: a-proteobacteria)]AZO79328.1 hypothetical protein BLM15_18240 [Bosea sp. Tri-49]RXT27259.1 hypothetical protein B5U98_00115 [Bosea sp. Tri-39]RXT36035.1 hypothetical protein B5U99_17885 [Bosea sp. Tri-54]